MVGDIIKMSTQGFLPRNASFSMYSIPSRKQALKLFDLMYFAVDFDFFIKVACWARRMFNPVMFYSAFSVALSFRPDCRGIVTPPMYEVLPNYFIPDETMVQFYKLRIEGVRSAELGISGLRSHQKFNRGDDGGLFGPQARLADEETLNYYRDDVGVSNWLVGFFTKSPSWLCPHKYKREIFRRGENFYYVHQQILARYLLERTANGLPPPEILNWDEPIKEGYNPKTLLSSGASLQARADGMTPSHFNQHEVQLAKTYERRLEDAIDAGELSNFNGTFVKLNNIDGTDLIGRAMLGVPMSVGKSFYGNYYFQALKALGFVSKTKNEDDPHSVGGAVTTIPTMLRDPALYNLLHKMISIFQRHKARLRPYSSQELGFPKVSIKSMVVSKLETYFEEFQFDVSNAFNPGKDELSYSVHQTLLNHAPFYFKLKIESETDASAMIRVFIGPKYDSAGNELTVEQSRLSFVELDRFPVNLFPGENEFKRSYSESPAYTKHPESFKSIYKRVEKALSGKEAFYITESSLCGVPQNIQLPKGSEHGKQFRLFAIVNHYVKMEGVEETSTDVTCGSSVLYDKRPMGFPFDRPVYGDYLFVDGLTNMKFSDVVIHHR